MKSTETTEIWCLRTQGTTLCETHIRAISVHDETVVKRPNSMAEGMCLSAVTAHAYSIDRYIMPLPTFVVFRIQERRRPRFNQIRERRRYMDYEQLHCSNRNEVSDWFDRKGPSKEAMRREGCGERRGRRGSAAFVSGSCSDVATAGWCSDRTHIRLSREERFSWHLIRLAAEMS